MRYLQAQGLGQGECAGANGMNGEVCLASRCERDAPVFNGPAVAHVKSAEYGIPVHSSSLHCTMSALSLHMFGTQEHTAVPVLLGDEQQLQLPPQLSLVCSCEAPDMTHLERKGTQTLCLYMHGEDRAHACDRASRTGECSSSNSQRKA